MNKEKKKILIVGGIVIFLLGILFLVFKLGIFSQSILIFRTYENTALIPIETGTFTFQNIIGTYETIGLGCYDSSGSPGGYYIGNEGSSNLDSDNELHFCNDLESNSRLIISSSNSITGSENGGTNYIQAKITLPAGTVKADYEYSISDYYGSNAIVSFTIGNEVKTFKTPSWHTYERGGSISGSGFYSFELTAPTEVLLRIDTITFQKNENAIGNLKIDFTPAPSKVTYYRLADKTCSEVLILPSEKTENDYLTLEECQNNLPKPIPFWFFVLVGFILVIGIVLIIFLNRRLHRR